MTTLDAASLAALRTLGQARCQALLALFLEHAARLLERYQRASAARDIAAAQAPIHDLRSASASVGALALSAHCREIEASLRAGRWPAAGAADELAACVAAACAAVRIEQGVAGA